MTSQVDTTTTKLQGYKQNLDNSRAEAHQWLQAIEGMADHITIRRIESLGIQAGWRCLEVGCGGGSIARWMSYRVGPDGHVLAVDQNTRFVADMAGPGLEVRQLDITEVPPPVGVFDFVHSRLVLQHLAQREQLVEQLAASLKPGGWLLLEEMETFSLFQNDTGPFRQVVEIMHAMGCAAGTAVNWARTLPGTFQRLGLLNVGAEGEMLYFSGGTPTAEYHRLTGELHWPYAEKMRLLTREQFDQYSASLRDPRAWFYGPIIFGVWGRRPPA
ncbi:class I SAM-dependent methyltransferase [Archangium sp.]|uniref:class I SAM-dependent methyltransferase n=1 Tax=Archangium sp. TaxID=1872627 RepID=UPI002D301715|nr:methyltransferase domain-containing protein [Archangium sp.]HYO52835.1 methyltransferase domain-containing protein [Archangium sp.]